MKTYSLKKSYRFLIIIPFITLIFSCGRGPKASSNSQLNGISKGFYTSFYKEDNQNVYYIKPLAFQANKEQLITDITFLKNSDEIENVIVNFSLFTTNKIARKDFISVKINDEVIENFKILYIEPKSSKQLEIRFTMPYSSNAFIKNYKNLNFTITTNAGSKNYLPTKKTSNTLQNIGLLFN